MVFLAFFPSFQGLVKQRYTYYTREKEKQMHAHPYIIKLQIIAPEGASGVFFFFFGRHFWPRRFWDLFFRSGTILGSFLGPFRILSLATLVHSQSSTYRYVQPLIL